jgi:hypothetical protein
MILWSRQEKYKTSLINTVLSQKVTNTQKMTNSYQNDIGIIKLKNQLINKSKLFHTLGCQLKNAQDMAE